MLAEGEGTMRRCLACVPALGSKQLRGIGLAPLKKKAADEGGPQVSGSEWCGAVGLDPGVCDRMVWFSQVHWPESD